MGQRQRRHRAGVALSSLPVGAIFYPPRMTQRLIERWRVWGPGHHGGVFVQERVLHRDGGRCRYAWGPAVEWSGGVLVEPVGRKRKTR